jgi:hypothetical protein
MGEWIVGLIGRVKALRLRVLDVLGSLGLGEADDDGYWEPKT